MISGEALAVSADPTPPSTIHALAGAVRRVELATLVASLGSLVLVAVASVGWLVGPLDPRAYLWVLALALPLLGLTAPLHARALEARLVVNAATRRAARQCRRLGHAAALSALLLAPLLAWFLTGQAGGPGSMVATAAAVLGLGALAVTAAQLPALVRARRDWSPAMLAPSDPRPTRTVMALQTASRRATLTAACAFLVILGAGTAATLGGVLPTRGAPAALAIPAALALAAAIAIQMTGLQMGAGRIDHAASWRSRARRLAFVHLPLLLTACTVSLQGLLMALAGGAGHGPLAGLPSPLLLAALAVSATLAAALINVGLLLTGLLAKTLVAPGRTARRIVDAVVSAILG